MTQPRFALSVALLFAGVLGQAPAHAQAAPTAAAASAAERAQRETDRTMYWIRVLADKPAPVKAAAAPKTVPAVAPAAVATPVPLAKAGADARDKLKVAAVATPAPAGPSTNPASAMRPATTLAPSPETSQPGVASGVDPNLSAAGPSTATAPPLPDFAPVAAAEPDPGLVQIKSVPPDFPGNVVQRVRKGSVEVQFEVEPGGTVTDAVVTRTTHSRLNDAAIEAVKQWRFKPSPKGHTAAVDLVFDIDHGN